MKNTDLKITEICHCKNIMAFTYRGRKYEMVCAEIEFEHYIQWRYYINKLDNNNSFWVSTRFIEKGTNDPVENSWYNMPKLTEEQMEELANDFMVNRKKYGN